jgi:HSP20 family molecular chaperone IbpA
MSRNPYPADWMWAQAVDFIEQAERMHRQFFRLASSPASQALWEPPADVFEDEHEVLVVVALPGVAAERVEIHAQPGAIVVRAERRQPFAGTRRAVRQLEIPYGWFERRIALPAGRFEVASHELTHGCLVLRLQKID